MKPRFLLPLAAGLSFGAATLFSASAAPPSFEPSPTATNPGTTNTSASKLAQRPRGPITSTDRQWWAFQPLAKVKVPKVRDDGWARTDLDRFIIAGWATAGLRPMPEASRTVLIRRLYFDLWGLPPSAQEIADFVADTRPDAYERCVDHLLESPHYGERWAGYWLDLVRYADSDGYKSDDLRPTAWLYRDYVIRSLNEDKSYARFVREQLAGDELYPDDPDARVATGYLRLGIYEYNNRDAFGQWTTILNDVTDTTGDVFLGLGFQCARCHDHKFDPILQKDYYRLQSFFAGLQWHDDVPVVTPALQAAHRARMDQWNAATASLQSAIDAIEAPYKLKAAETAISKFPPEIQTILRKPEGERDPYEQQIGELAYRQIRYEQDHIAGALSPADKEAVASLRKRLQEEAPPAVAPLPVALTVSDVGRIAPPTTIPKRPDEVIAPEWPAVLCDLTPSPIPAPATLNSTGRRAALATWLTQPNHPLTSRVMVNRVWQHHMGRGLVPTASDFGHLGEKPSHPELLDWLATRFVAEGWSLKKLHRLIVTSAVYRQSSSLESIAESSTQSVAKAAETRAAWQRGQLADPENRWYWRGQTRRLDAEQIRDSLLVATGELRPEVGGPATDASQFRRSVYTKVLRNTREPLMDVFDIPQHFSSTPSRNTTTTPVQSLLLINSRFMLDRAKAMARRVESEAQGDPTRAIELAYLRTFGRTPTADETREAKEFLTEQERRVDPELAQSAAAGFASDRIPFRDGRAALMAPRSSQQTLTAPLNTPRPEGDFTVEAFVFLRSVSDEATIRTIASQGNSKTASAGWALGVSGKKSDRAPHSLLLQLKGQTAAGQPKSEEIGSDLPIHTDKPYYLGASVHFDAEGSTRVTFYVKDLSNDEEPLQTTQARSEITRVGAGEFPVILGGCPENQNLWDGLLDDVRLSLGALNRDQLEWPREGVTPQTLGLWQFEAKPSYFRDATAHHHDLQPGRTVESAPLSASTLALADFCHALLNANEFLYVP